MPDIIYTQRQRNSRDVGNCFHSYSTTYHMPLKVRNYNLYSHFQSEIIINSNVMLIFKQVNIKHIQNTYLCMHSYRFMMAMKVNVGNTDRQTDSRSNVPYLANTSISNIRMFRTM